MCYIMVHVTNNVTNNFQKWLIPGFLNIYQLFYHFSLTVPDSPLREKNENTPRRKLDVTNPLNPSRYVLYINLPYESHT